MRAAATLGFVLIASLTMEVRGQTPAQTPPTWRLVEEWRKGGQPEGPYAFEDVIDLKAMPGGRLIVLERKSMQAYIYDSAGRSLKAVGRSGGGPGEFRSPLGIAVASDGRFMVNDQSLSRLSLFSASGDYLRGITVRRPFLLFFKVNWDASFDRNGRLVASVGLPPRERDARVPGSNSPFADSVLVTERWTNDFARSDTAALCSSPMPVHVSPADYALVRAGPAIIEGRGGAPSPPSGSVGWMEIPFMQQRPYYARDLDGFEWGPSSFGSGELVRRESGKCGTVIARVTLRGPRARIPSPVRDSALKNVHADHTNRVPREYAWYRALRVDDQNQLWVERNVEGGKRFDVFSHTGQPLAEIVIPPQMLVDPFPQIARIAIANGRVYGFVKDADDVRYLVAWRIVR